MQNRLILNLSYGFFLLISVCTAYINIQQYCKAFDENFQPIICILKNNKNATSAPHHHPPRPPHPHPQPIYPILYPDYSGPPPPHPPDFDNDDDECSCDMNCYPVIANQNGTGVSYNCRSCGSSCSIRGTKAKCNCATPAGNSTCTCTATCASFRHYSHYEDDDDDDEDDSSENSNCIFNVNLTDRRLGQEQRPYNCECCRSKTAEITSEPDFVCICQRVSTNNDVRLFDQAIIDDDAIIIDNPNINEEILDDASEII